MNETVTSVSGLILIAVFLMLVPILLSFFIKTFYDDSLILTKPRIIIAAILNPVLIIGTVFLIVLTNIESPQNYIIIFLALFICIPVFALIFSLSKGRKKKQYVETCFLFFIMANGLYLSLMPFYLMFEALVGQVILTIIQKSPDTITDGRTAEILCLAIPGCVVCLMILSVILIIYRKFIRKKTSLLFRPSDSIMMVLFLVMGAVCVFISIGDLYGTNANVKYSDTSLMLKMIREISLIILMVIMPVMIVKGRLVSHFNELSTRNEQFLEAELVASNAYKQSQEDTRAFRHDMNNNLTVLAALMSKHDYAEAEEYLGDLRGKLSSFSPKVVTGDDMLDALISSKIPAIEAKGIEFSTDGVIDGGLCWKPIDICAVFANMIDNAVEACEKVTDGGRYIRLSLKKTEHQRLILMKNSVAQKVDCEVFNDEARFTSKDDKSRHGFGMKNIKSALEKYGAMMQVDCDDNEFSTRIVSMR